MSAPISSDAHNRAKERETLHARRARAKRRMHTLYTVLVLVLIGAAVWGAWQSHVRVQTIAVEGDKAEALQSLAKGTLAGTYALILPRDSFFFLSESAIRNKILNTFPDLSAVSVSRTGLTSLSVSVVERVAAFRWCGASVASTSPCYLTDAEGLVFKEMDVHPATSTEMLLALYAPLSETQSASSSPLRSHVAGADKVPASLRFIGALSNLGASIDRLQLRGDEADVFIKGTHTRITYVLGHEEDAATLAGVTLPKLGASLLDGSVDYVDLRFPGKAYFKKQ